MGKDTWNGALYKNNSKPQKNSSKRILDSFPFTGNESILDMGCGDGKTTYNIAKQTTGNVIGIDKSKSMLIEAQKYKLKNLSFEVVDIEKINFSDEFDIIFSFATLHWIEDQLALLKKVKKSLKKNGIIFFSILSNIGIPIKKLYKQKKWKSYFESRKDNIFLQTKKNYISFLKKTNFKNIKVSLKKSNYLFKNKKDLFLYCIPWIHHLTGLKIGKDKEFTKDLVDYVYKINKKKDEDSILVTVPILEITAKS